MYSMKFDGFCTLLQIVSKSFKFYYNIMFIKHAKLIFLLVLENTKDIFILQINSQIFKNKTAK